MKTFIKGEPDPIRRDLAIVLIGSLSVAVVIVVTAVLIFG